MLSFNDLFQWLIWNVKYFTSHSYNSQGSFVTMSILVHPSVLRCNFAVCLIWRAWCGHKEQCHTIIYCCTFRMYISNKHSSWSCKIKYFITITQAIMDNESITSYLVNPFLLCQTDCNLFISCLTSSTKYTNCIFLKKAWYLSKNGLISPLFSILWQKSIRIFWHLCKQNVVLVRDFQF